MLTRRQFAALTVLGALALLLALANAALFTINRDAQAALAQRQQYVQQSIALEGLYRDIVKGLAELDVDKTCNGSAKRRGPSFVRKVQPANVRKVQARRGLTGLLR